MDIHVTVSGTTAYLSESASIVCGNSGYSIVFDFSDEWDAYTSKTAEFIFFSGGSFKKKSVLFQGDAVNIPVIPTTNDLMVRIYAGDLMTTTDAHIPCIGEMTEHDPPSPDVYNQLMEYLAGLQGGGSLAGLAALQIAGALGGISGKMEEAE